MHGNFHRAKDSWSEIFSKAEAGNYVPMLDQLLFHDIVDRSLTIRLTCGQHKL